MNTLVATASLAASTAVSAPSIVPTGDDPVFAAIDAHQKKHAEFLAGIAARLSDEITDELLDEEGDLLADLMETQPTTMAGGVAVLRYVGTYCIKNSNAMFENCVDPLNSAGAGFLHLMSDAFNVMTSGPAMAAAKRERASDDPVFAAIERFRSAFLAMEFKRLRYNHFEEKMFAIDAADPRRKHAENLFDRVASWTSEATSAMRELAETVPTSRAGALALAAIPNDPDFASFESDWHEEILASVGQYLQDNA